MTDSPSHSSLWALPSTLPSRENFWIWLAPFPEEDSYCSFYCLDAPTWESLDMYPVDCEVPEIELHFMYIFVDITVYQKRV